MILFVDAEHEKGYEQPWGESLLAWRTRITYRLEDLTGHTCLLQRYHRVDPDFLEDHDIEAVFISGSGTDPHEFDPAEQEGLRLVVQQAEVPVFGFCGGFQFMAQALGSPIERIGRLDADEEDPNESFMPGWKSETGYLPVENFGDHPLVAGLGPEPVFRHWHGWEIKNLPAGMENHARTATTENQLVVDEQHRRLGTQFHPEYYTDEHPAGRILIENFATWTGLK